MAQLKDLIVNGASRLIGDAFVNKIQITSISAPTSAGGSTYNTGTDGQVLKSNGTSVYWTTLGTIASAAAGDYVLKSGDTMTGKLTVVGNGSSAFNNYGIHFTNNSRIGENSSGGLGIYAPDKVYIRPGSSTTSSSYGLEVTTAGITVGSSDIIFATGSNASIANGISFKNNSTIVGHIGMDNASTSVLGIYSKNDIAIRPGSGSIATTDGFTISTTAITPKKDATMNIGTSSYKFANIYGTLKGNADTASAVPLSGVTGADDLKAIEALTGTSGILKKTAANTWTLDTTAYTTNTGTVTKVTAGTGLNTSADQADSATKGSITTTGTLYLTKSGVTAGSYGPSAAVTGNEGTTMNVPYITVDAYGRVTSISNKVYTAKNTTYTFTAGTSTLAWNSEVTLATVGGLAIKAKLPANPNTNTDTLVKQTAKTDSVEYKILSTTSASPTSGNAAEAAYGADFTINPSAKTITSPNYKVTANATITYNTTNGCLEIIV